MNDEELKEFIEKELKMLEKVREELMEQLFQLSKKKLKNFNFELWKRKKKWIDGKINYYRYLLPYLVRERWKKKEKKEIGIEYLI